MAVGDIYRVAIEGIAPDSQAFANVLHYRHEVTDFGDEQATMEALAGRIADVVLADCYLGMISTSAQVTRIVVTNYAEPKQGAELVGPWSGEATGSPAPGQNSALFLFKTGILGRRYQGRMFAPALTESVYTGSALDSGYLAFAGIWLANCVQLTTLGVTVWQQCVYSPTFDLKTPVIAVSIVPYVRTQRRRSFGFGS